MPPLEHTLPDTILRAVQDFLHARIALDQLEDRLIGWSFDAHEWAPDATLATILAIETLLWRHRAEQLTLSDLRRRLMDLLT